MIRLGRLIALFALGRPAAGDYNLWHAIDAQMVVCPIPARPAVLPTGMTTEDWPTAKEFSFNINVDSEDQLKPHIVTFFHSGTSAVDITFQIDDAHGDSVVPSRTVRLAAVSGLTREASACACTGTNTGVNASFGANYGTSCSAWDQASCTDWHPSLTPGPWCCQQWCYVSSTCSDSMPSTVVDGLRYSYVGACGTTDTSSCSYTPPDPCAPINVDNAPQWSAENRSSFGFGYGSICRTWDYNWCSTMYAPNIVDTWCCSSWAWVSEACESAIASEVWPGLFWSDAVCPDNQRFVSTCPYKRSDGLSGPALIMTSTVVTDPACECLGYAPSTLTAGRRRYTTNGATYPSDYGSSCAAWDAQKCSDFFPRDTTDIWCCQSWCYVDEDCSSANPSAIYPGSYWSYESCPDDGLTLANCAYSNVCQPSGSNAGLPSATLTQFGSNYGTSCSAWDKNSCYTWYGSTDWWTLDSKDWCCDSWAYVNGSCPTAEPTTLGAAGLFFSYSSCADDASLPVYNTNNNQCEANTTRRLGEEGEVSAEEEEEEEEDEQEEEEEENEAEAPVVRFMRGLGEVGEEDEDEAEARRLSSRRRGGSRFSSGSRSRSASSSSRYSFSGSRRRAVSTPRRRTPTRSSSTARRRSPPVPPPPPSPATMVRRRAVPSPPTPRRRVVAYAARRRAPAPLPPAATGRRREPANLPTTNVRRRTAPEDRRRGPAPAPAPTPRRRRTPPPEPADARRRRTADVSGTSWNTLGTQGGTPRRRYGYTGRNQLQENYGYSYPSRTDYGYTGHGPSSNSGVKLAMAAAGGAALGIGGYYLYTQYSNGNWATGTPYLDRSWCTVPSGEYQGRMIRCIDCAQYFGQRDCRSNNGCFQSQGCDYSLPRSTQRDDIMATGFIPGHYTQPLTMTITGIVGNDFLENQICDSTQPDGSFDTAWLRKSSFDVKVYATLTQMEDFDPVTAQPGSASTAAGANSVAAVAGAAAPCWWLFLAFAALAVPRSFRRL